VIEREHKFAGQVLSLIPINGLEERLQEQVLAQGDVLEFKKKKTIFEAGARDPYTYYLLEGELELLAKGAAPMRMTGGDSNANRALAQLQPRRYTAKALSPVTVFRIERAVLDHILSDEQLLEEGSGIVEVAELEEEHDDGDWMTRLISSELFTRLPHDHIQQFFAELEAVEVRADEVVVEQGTPGDFLYIVAEGKAAVTRRAPGAGQDLQLAILKEGDTFGEEALISNSPRNASVKMLSDGFIMRLPKSSFQKLVSNPTLKAVPYSEACKLVEQGAVWLDVRFKDEHESNAIEGSRNIPLNLMRVEAAKLDKSKRYVVYCDSGARSSTAAFLLARCGVDASYLAGGLARTPLGQDMPATTAAEQAAEDDSFEMVTGGGMAAEKPAAAKDDAPPPLPETAVPATPPGGEARPPAVKWAAAGGRAPDVVSGKGDDELAKVRAELTKIKTERDKIAVKARQAVDAAKELKRRHDAQLKAIQEETNRREALENELAAVKADLERNTGLERARLESDLEHANKKLEDLQAEREQLNARVEAAEEASKNAAAKIEELEAIRVNEEVAFQDRLETANSEVKAQKSRAEKSELEVKELRAQLKELKASADKLMSTQELQQADIQRAMKEAGTDLEEERSKIAAERVELERLKDSQKNAEEQLKKEKAALAREAAALKERAEALDIREMGLEELRGSLDSESARRKEALAKTEAELAREKANWKQQVEQAIVQERKRMEAAFAKYKQEATESARKLAQEFAEQRVAEARADFEAEAVEIRARAEAEIEELRAKLKAMAADAGSEAESLVARVRAEYETRLAEQEAVLEDERSRLESENVRLREALAEARPSGAQVPGPPAPAIPEPAAPAATPAPGAGPAPQAPDLVIEGPDLEIIDHEPATPGSEATAEAIPAIDLGEDDEFPTIDTETESAGGPSDDRERVLTPAQLADIRRKMQEKMKSVKKSA
jgi:CRP-like cAMP-binding protein/rhodanese-related sulfurtransferase